MFILIVGGGNIGYYLAKTLNASGHEVVIMEKDRQVHRIIADELGEMAVQGDGCEVRLLEEAGAARADAVVAVTGDDEDNLVICQMAKRMFNVPRTIARVNNPMNEELFHQLGVDAAVSSTKIIQSLIEQEIETGDVIPLAALKRGRLEVVDIDITEQCPVLGTPIGELNLPPESLIMCIVREERAMIPHSDHRLEVGDEIVVLVRAELEPDLRTVFAADVG